jgi:hypothetical protein
MDKTLDYSKREAVTLHASAAARCCSAFRRRLDVRYLIWEVVPCRLAAGSAALERRPAVPDQCDCIIRTRSPTAALARIARAAAASVRAGARHLWSLYLNLIQKIA